MLRERLSRKEDLLKDYEKDLGKLRQAEILLREKEHLLQDLEVKPTIRFLKGSKIVFRFRRTNAQKMMKHFFSEIH